MPLLSSNLLIQCYGILVIALGIGFIVSPTSILTSPTLTILGDSMHIRPASYIPLPSLTGRQGDTTTNPLTSLTKTAKTGLTTSERELLALLGGVLSLSALTMMILATPLSFSKSSLTSRTSHEGKMVRKSTAEVGETISRLVQAQDTFMAIAGVHVFVTGSIVVWIYLTKNEMAAAMRSAFPSSAALVANQTSFIFALMDMLVWGYLYTTLKEERRQALITGQARREADEEEEKNALE